MPAAVISLTWLRLESPITHWPTLVAVATLGVAPAFVRPRPVAILPAALLVVRFAFGQWPRHVGRAATRFANGFLDFYDVRTPFDPRTHADMRGVILVAIFAFVLLVAVAVARRSVRTAVGGVLLGAGWPATLAGNHAALGVGVAVLVAALCLLAGLTTRRVPRAVVPAVAVLALVALAASASSAVAKSGLVSWQTWDFYNAPDRPVSVSFAWNADYGGISFPKKRTRVLEIDAPRRSLFWRAAVLDVFGGDRWQEVEPLQGDSLEPHLAQTSALLHQTVHVLALSDTRLVGASVPLSFDAGDAPIVQPQPGFAQLPGGLTQGFSYGVTSYAPRPTAAQLQAAPPAYPAELTAPGTFLDVWPGVTAPAFGAPRRTMLDRHPDIERYVPMLHAALTVAGGARTPFAATTRILHWFRQSGGFTYSNRPAIFSEAPLVGFIAETRAGYCQQFAGAMALMLRYLGIPARVAVGFSSGTYDAKHHRWDVTDHDAHAWVEAWFRGYGWLPFDPTPSTGRPERGELSAPYAKVSTPTSFPVGPLPHNTAGDNAAASGHHHGEEGTTRPPGFEGPAVARPHRHTSLLLLLLLIALAIGGGITATKIALRRARYLTRDPRRVAAACRQELADYLLDQRIEGARSATLHELGALVRDELAVDPESFVAAATAARFGPPVGSTDAARQARRELRALLRRIRRTLDARDRARGLLSLRSLGFAA